MRCDDVATEFSNMRAKTLEYIKENGLCVFEIDNLPDADFDFSENESIDNFIKLAKDNGIKAIFYNYTNLDIKRELINIDIVKENLRAYYDELIESHCFSLNPYDNLITREEFIPYFEDAFKEISEEIQEYNEEHTDSHDFKFEELSLYCIYNGKTISYYIDNNTEGYDTEEITDRFYTKKYKPLLREKFQSAYKTLREEQKTRYKQMEEQYNVELNAIKDRLKSDTQFVSIKTKTAKIRYTRKLFSDLKARFPQVATKVSFKEMIDDTLAELEEEK